jgi:hypothetical protein
MTTDREWLQSQLDRYSYRSGWTWELLYDASFWAPAFSVKIDFQVPDAYQPEQEVQIVSGQAIPPWVVTERDPELFKRWFQTVIFNTEMHESREWLRRDGVLVDDPHRDSKIV